MLPLNLLSKKSSTVYIEAVNLWDSLDTSSPLKLMVSRVRAVPVAGPSLAHVGNNMWLLGCSESPSTQLVPNCQPEASKGSWQGEVGPNFPAANHTELCFVSSFECSAEVIGPLTLRYKRRGRRVPLYGRIGQAVSHTGAPQTFQKPQATLASEAAGQNSKWSNLAELALYLAQKTRQLPFKQI